MIEYKNKSEAVKERDRLVSVFQALKERQEHLKSYIRNGYYEDQEVRDEIHTNRKFLVTLEKRIRKVKQNIIRIDKESAARFMTRECLK